MALKKREAVTHIKPVPKEGSLRPEDQPQAPPKYRAEEFLIPAHDERDQSISYGYRAGKLYAQMMSKIVWSRTFPYGTPGDIQRHAIHRHLQWLDTLEPGLITNDLAQLRIINENISQGEQAVSFADSIEKLEQVVGRLLSLKLRGMAIKMIYQTRKDAKKIENPLLRDLYLSEIKARFHGLLNNQGIELTAVSEESDEHEDAIHRSWGYDESEVEADEIQSSHGTPGTDSDPAEE